MTTPNMRETFGPLPKTTEVRRLCRQLADQLPLKPGPLPFPLSVALAECVISCTWAKSLAGGYVPHFVARRAGAVLTEARGTYRFADSFTRDLRRARARQMPSQRI